MKKLMLATVSALALGLAGIGTGYAQTPSNANPNMQAPDMSATRSTSQPSTQAEQGMPAQQGAQATNASVHLSRQQVRQVQQQLKTAGLYKGRIDGAMGRETRQALRSFQQQNNLQATGRPDQQTMAALQNGTTGSGGSAMTPGAESQPDNATTNGTATSTPQQGENSDQMPANNQMPNNH